MKERLIGPLVARWKWFATAVRVQERFSEVHGGYLAAAITLASFLSIFPLLLLAVAVVGYLSLGADIPAQIIGRLGLTGEAARAVTSAIATAQASRKGALGIGAVGLLWSGLSMVAAIQYAFDNVWQVKGRGMKDKLAGLLWLGGAAVIMSLSFALTAVLTRAPWLAPLSILLGLGANFAMWLWTLKALLNLVVPWRALVPGAVLGAVGLEVLKLVGGIYVPRLMTQTSGLYGSIGVVFAILAWLFFFGRLAVLVAVLSVVRWEEDNGTVTVEIELPRHPDTVAVEATRAGEAKDPVQAPA
ncbi:MAG: YihY/virulence factor BrkB family protein [Actinobacteria bacterium]|nr:YihY/virulence factor BrkB family protein [Actinomycetota bacterium]MBW3649371.1 YihY/virulence factor BrkB family protein [Actinomycetota bacterium]